MSKRFYLALFAGVSLAFAPFAIAQPSQLASQSVSGAEKQQADVLAVVERFHAAIKSGDATLAERVLAADVSIYEQGHREASRAEYLGHHFKEDVAFAKAVPSTVESRVARVSGELAVVTAESSATGTYKEKPVKTANLSTYVLAKREGNWVIVHVHWSSRRRQ